MDPRKNPFAPGAGAPPPELAGRSELIERSAVALDRIRDGKSARSFIYYGLRGVGKTVLLNKIRRDAEARGFACVWIEAPEKRSLPASLVPPLRQTLVKLSAGAAARAGLSKALAALAGFVGAMRVKYSDIEVVLDVKPQRGTADSGELMTDLAELLKAVGGAAQECGTAVILFVDEIQYVAEDQLAALISALQSTSLDQLPVTMLAAGLPQILGQMGKAKSYAERLFEFVLVDRLDEIAARAAICIPAEKEGVQFQSPAVEHVLSQTRGYPYFLQEWGKHSWEMAPESPIRVEDVSRASAAALAALDASFFRVRFDRLTPTEKMYMRALAELGRGPHRSGDVARLLKKKVSTVAPLRNSLIAKGMVYSPAHGDTAFTVPLFDGFMKRIMPTLNRDLSRHKKK